jgi:predicted phosphate transport protein (TIGR00153 family)
MILFKKEKEVLGLIEKHADKVEECLSTSLNTLQAYLNGDIASAKKLARQVDNLETQADFIRHHVRDRLYGGAYMPLLREDVYKLVESVDMVANAAEKCCDAFLNQRPVIPESLKQDFLTIIMASTGVIKPLKHSLLCYLKGLCPIEVSRQHAKDVGLIESKVDSLDWDLTKKIFSSDLRHSHKLHLKICVEHIADITDKAEYAADYLEVVALKAMI